MSSSICLNHITCNRFFPFLRYLTTTWTRKIVGRKKNVLSWNQFQYDDRHIFPSHCSALSPIGSKIEKTTLVCSWSLCVMYSCGFFSHQIPVVRAIKCKFSILQPTSRWHYITANPPVIKRQYR